jgi:hypothetical protein
VDRGFGAARRRLAIGRIRGEGAVWLGLFALLAVRVGLSLHAIAFPGLDMDETLFVNAATLRLPGVYIAHEFHGVPLMVFPYIGALKSWLYDPVFAVLGTSPTTIRLPAVLITSAGLLALYLAVRQLVNRPVAILVFVVLCFDNSIFWLTRDDVGPSAIELFLKCAAVFCAARFARAPAPRWTILLLATLALGTFNKLNFIWTVNAATAVSLLIAVRHRALLREHLKTVATWVAGLAVLYACFGLYYYGDHIGSLVAPAAHCGLLDCTWPQFERGIGGILSGTWFYDYALGPLPPRDAVVAIVLVLFAVGAIASVASRRSGNLAVAGLAIATILIAAQNILTVQATAGWHYISIEPFATVVAGYGVYVVARRLLRAEIRTQLAIACVGLAALVYDGALMHRYFQALEREPRFSAWSPAVYNLSNRLKHMNATVFTADWGIFNPLFALQPGRRYQELGYGLAWATAADLKAIGLQLAGTPGPKLVITHATAKLAFPRSRSNLFKAAGSHLRLQSTIPGADGAPVYELYTYR